MKKTKFLLIVFALMLLVCIAGSAMILTEAKKQTIDDFKLNMTEGSDPAVLNNVDIDVDYDIGEDSEFHFWYSNGRMEQQEFCLKTARDYGDLNELYPEGVYISDGKMLTPMNGLYAVVEKNTDGGLVEGRLIEQIVPEDFQTDIESDNYLVKCENKIWSKDSDMYIFYSGLLYKIPKTELLELGTISLIDAINAEPAAFEPIYMVPEEVDVLVGFDNMDLLTIVGVGDVSTEGYTLYTYIVEPATGETIHRQVCEKKMTQDAAEANQSCFQEYNEQYRKTFDEDEQYVNLMSYDCITCEYSYCSAGYSVVTIMQPTGCQDMFVIEWVYDWDKYAVTESRISQLEVPKLLGENTYICGMLDTDYKTDTLYLCYAEGVSGEFEYNESWAERVIMNLNPMEMSEKFPQGREDNNFNGIALIAIQSGGVVYKGYFSSETYRAMGKAVENADNNGIPVYDEWEYPEAVVSRIRISVSPALQ